MGFCAVFALRAGTPRFPIEKEKRGVFAAAPVD